MREKDKTQFCAQCGSLSSYRALLLHAKNEFHSLVDSVVVVCSDKRMEADYFVGFDNEFGKCLPGASI